jgi:hypothetical protein
MAYLTFTGGGWPSCSAPPPPALSGAAIGLAGALTIAFVIYRLGHRLNLARFFTVIGVRWPVRPARRPGA